MVDVVCVHCNGAGATPVDPGFGDKLAYACVECMGTGKDPKPRQLFKSRRPLEGIEFVTVTWDLHRDHPEGSVSYADFLQGKLPEVRNEWIDRSPRYGSSL